MNPVESRIMSAFCIALIIASAMLFAAGDYPGTFVCMLVAITMRFLTKNPKR